MQSYYPYLLCGLPELKFQVQPENFSYEDISAQIFELLSPSDARKAHFFLALGNHDVVVDKILGMEDEDQKKDFLQTCTWPDYQKEFYSHTIQEILGKEENEAVSLEDPGLFQEIKRRLDSRFYQAAAASPCRFIRQWYEFDSILKNTLVAFVGRGQKRDVSQEFVYAPPKGHTVYQSNRDLLGEENENIPELIVWIKENLNQGDFGLKYRLAYAQELFAALEKEDVFEREVAIDRFRWNMADELVQGKDFQFDVVLAYLLKASILLRWQKMKIEKGRSYLQDVVAELRHVNLQGSAN